MDRKEELEYYLNRYREESSINQREELKIEIKKIELEIDWKLTAELRYLFSYLLHILKNHEYLSSAIPWYGYLYHKREVCRKYNISF